MENIQKYSLLLLRADRALTRCIKQFDNITLAKACNTHSFGCQYSNTIQQISKLQHLIDLRGVLVYLQQCIRDSIDSVPAQYRQLLVWLYVKNYTKESVARHVGYSMRTLYRRLGTAKEYYYNQLVSRGITYDWLLTNVKPIVDCVC